MANRPITGRGQGSRKPIADGKLQIAESGEQERRTESKWQKAESRLQSREQRAEAKSREK